MIQNYNSEVYRIQGIARDEQLDSLNTDSEFISWSRNLKKKAINGKVIEGNDSVIVKGMYRPFVKKYLYYLPDIIEYPRTYNTIFNSDNLLISITGASAQREFSALVIKEIPEYKLMENGRHFYLKDYEDKGFLEMELSNVRDEISKKLNLNSEEVFYYVYAILNSPEYKNKYANDLSKDLPRIPIVKNKEKFVDVGRKLANLHLNYEDLPAPQGIEISYKTQMPSYRVQKMKHPGRDRLDTIIFNSDIIIKNIPQKAYDYVVNGRPAIEWIIDQYQVKLDKKSGIVDDPNNFDNNEKYIFNLLLSIINLSIKTVDLINSIPSLDLDE